jgi:DNA-binding IclR family transcriptional regulator
MPGNEPVKSLIRGLDILMFVAQGRDGRRLSDISEQMRLNPSTVHNLVKSLRLKGFVEKCADGRLRTGGVFRELMKASSSSDLHGKVEAEMKNIAGKVGNAILTFSEISHSDICATLRMSPDMPGIIQRSAAIRFHLYYNVSALVYLAFGDPDGISWLKLSHPFIEEGLTYWKDEETLMAYLQKTISRGYAISIFSEKDVLRLAVPVFSGKGPMRGSLGISVRLRPDEHANTLEKTCSEMLISAARTISETTEE